MANITSNGKEMTVTMDDRRTASRATQNFYQAAVVGMKNGRLCILSAHYNASNARDAMANVLAGKFVSHKFTGATALQIVERSEEWEPLSAEQQEEKLAAECLAIREGRPAREAI